MHLLQKTSKNNLLSLKQYFFFFKNVVNFLKNNTTHFLKKIQYTYCKKHYLNKHNTLSSSNTKNAVNFLKIKPTVHFLRKTQKPSTLSLKNTVHLFKK